MYLLSEDRMIVGNFQVEHIELRSGICGTGGNIKLPLSNFVLFRKSNPAMDLADICHADQKLV